jgi:hypothetical protein
VSDGDRPSIIGLISKAEAELRANAELVPNETRLEVLQALANPNKRHAWLEMDQLLRARRLPPTWAEPLERYCELVF